MSTMPSNQTNEKISGSKLAGLLSDFMDSASDSMTIYDKDFHLVWINEYGAQLLPGQPSRDELFGKHVNEFIEGFTEKTRFQEYLNVLKTGVPYYSEDKIPQPFFGDKYFSVSVFKVGDGLGFMVSDITDRKRAENKQELLSKELLTVNNELKDAASKLHGLIDGTSDLISALDINYQFIAFNTAYKYTFKEKYKSDIKVGDTFSAHMSKYPEHLKKILREWEKALRGEEFQVLRENEDEFGKKTYLEIRYTSIRDRDGILIGAAQIIRDTTMRKRAEIALTQSEERYRSLTESTTSVVWTANVDGEFDSPQPSWEQYTGQNREESSGTKYLTAFQKEDQEGIKKAWQRAKNNKEMFRADGRIWSEKHQQYRYFTAKAVPLYNEHAEIKEWVGTINDIHDQKIAQEENHRLALIVESSDDAIFAMDLNGKIVSWNLGAEKIFEYNSAEIIDESVDKLIVASNDNQMGNILEMLQQGIKIEHFETKWITKTHNKIDVSINISAILDEEEKFIGASIIARDITEKKKADEQLEKQAKELAIINKELKEFTYIASHDLKVPIANIEQLVEVLREDDDVDDDEREDFLQRISKMVDRSKETIQSLVDVTRIRENDELIEEEVNLSLLLEELLQMFSKQIEETNATIDANFSACNSITFPKSSLKSVLQNLLSNSIKYRSPKRTPVINLSTKKTDNHIALKIEDNGLGIDLKSNEGTAFGMYNRFHSHVEGTGLGLYIIKQTLEKLGGSIELESTLDKGTTFTLYFKR